MLREMWHLLFFCGHSFGVFRSWVWGCVSIYHSSIVAILFLISWPKKTWISIYRALVCPPVDTRDHATCLPTHPPPHWLYGLEWNRIVIINSLSWAPCSFCIFIPSGKLLIHQFTPFCLQLFLYMFVIVQRMMMMVMIDGRFCCVQSNESNW